MNVPFNRSFIIGHELDYIAETGTAGHLSEATFNFKTVAIYESN